MATTEVPLDDVLWRFCEAVLALPVEQVRGLEIYRRMEVLLTSCPGAPRSLSYESVWGEISSEDLPLEFPDGCTYDPEKDRLYFRDPDCLFLTLRRWYRDGVAMFPHPWLVQRAAAYERMIERLEVFVDGDDLSDLLERVLLAPPRG